MKRDLKELRPGSKEWEAICQRCGRCCYEKLDYRGKIFYTNKPCTYLDTRTNACRIYQQRSIRNPECARLTPELAGAGILPADCPYVADVDNYPAPERFVDFDNY
jgi:uncharacterized cysteine cluster protein YcgN (CxxCxxCC family)